MPPELTITERASLRRFLALWRDEAVKSGFNDVGYMTAAHHELRGYAVYCRLRSAIGSTAVQAMFAECEGLAA